MSSIYTLEPATKGKVVFDTDYGDVDIELWSKETPAACRNFVQLCLDGYYDGVIVHRIVENFLVQTGDPTGTGQGGSAAGESFKTETHGRLKFSHRGLVGMAADGPEGTNESQFFITLAATPELDKKHTIFGKVTGHTIYNVLKMSETECDEDERPLQPPMIKSCNVVDNPFPDLTARADTVEEEEEVVEQPVAPKNKKRGKKKDFNLLSFGEEAEEEESKDIAAAKKIRVKSRPDLVEDKTLHAQSSSSTTTKEKRNRDGDKAKKQRVGGDDDGDGDDDDDETKERKRRAAKKVKLKEERRQLVADLKRSDGGGTNENGDSRQSNAGPVDAASADAASFLNSQREMYKSKAAVVGGKSREAQTMALMAQFQKNLDKGSDSMEWVPKEGLQFKSNDVNYIPNHTDTLEYDIVDPRNPTLKRVRDGEKKKKHSKHKRHK